MCYSGVYQWVEIEGNYLPCVARIINGIRYQFVAERHAKTMLLDKFIFPIYVDGLEKSFYVSGRHRMSFAEAELLTSVNYDHLEEGETLYLFYPGKDRIVLKENVFGYYHMIKPRYRNVVRAPGQ